MKTLILAIALALPALSQANDNYEITIDWSKNSTLSDSVVQQCDDSYFPAVEITVPGVVNHDFSIEMGISIAHGDVSPGCSVKSVKKNGAKSVTYTLDADGGGCSIRVYQLRPARGQKPKSALFELHDAC